jgi:hypothetical protein
MAIGPVTVRCHDLMCVLDQDVVGREWRDVGNIRTRGFGEEEEADSNNGPHTGSVSFNIAARWRQSAQSKS